MSFTAVLGSLDVTADELSGVRWSTATMDGLGSTGSTISPVQKPRQSGAWAGEAFSTSRHLVLSGLVQAPTQALLIDARNRLIDAASLATTPLTVTEDGSSWTSYVRRNDEVIFTYLTDVAARWSVQLIAVDHRKFGSPLTGSTLLPASSGGLILGSTVVRTNLITNPSFETNTTGWADVSATLSRTTAEFYSGVASLKVDISGASAGQGTYSSLTSIGSYAGYSFSGQARVKAPAGTQLQLEMRTFNTGGVMVPSVVVPFTATGGWDLITADGGTVGTQAASITYMYISKPTTGAALSFYVDNTFIVLNPTSGTFFDGSTAPAGAFTYAWTGAANASTSTETNAGIAVPFSIPGVTVSGQVSLTNPGNETGPVIIRIDGPTTGPVITHTGIVGSSLVFASSLVLGVGEWLTIDMEKRTVMANDQASRSGYITSRGWFGFDPGVNTFTFTASGYNAASLMTVTASPSWK